MKMYVDAMGGDFAPQAIVEGAVLAVRADKDIEKIFLVGDETRVVLRIPAPLAPVKVAVLPLVKKDGLPELAEKIMNRLKLNLNCQYEEKDSIGKRYRRQDAIGTPFCITVDHQSAEDGTVTLRHRDTMEQERVSIDDIERIVTEKCDIKNLLRQLM